MSKPHLVLINTIDTSQDDLPEEFVTFKNSLPPDSQMSMFDIILHEEGELNTWFNEAIIKIEEGEKDD